MIVYEKKITWLSMFFTFRGSILSRIWMRLLAATLFALLATLCFDYDVAGRLTRALGWAEPLTVKDFDMTTLPFTLVGTALAIFLGFRNNSSYDRFWEGRKLWGRMINTTRTITRQVMMFVEDDAPATTPLAPGGGESLHHQLIYRLIGYLHAFRHHLRDERDFSDCAPFMTSDEYAKLIRDPNPPAGVMHRFGQTLERAWREDFIDTYHLPVLEQSLVEVLNIQGGCERIKKTPIPFAYTVLMHRIVGIYCFALPFGVYATIGDLTPLVVMLVSYGFLGLDAIGDEIEEPFGKDPNDLPLTSFCVMLERECRHRLGESELPAPVKPIDHVLM